MLHYHRGEGNNLFYNLYTSPGWLNNYPPLLPSPPGGRRKMRGSTSPGRFEPGHDDPAGPWLQRPPTIRAVACVSPVKRSPCFTPAAANIATLLKKTELKLEIYTNNLTSIPTLIDRFIELKVDDLQFSIQGLTPAQYEFNSRGN